MVRKIFPHMAERVDKGLCPICGQKIDPAKFKDELSIKEYELSGMCQVCQDETFK